MVAVASFAAFFNFANKFIFIIYFNKFFEFGFEFGAIYYRNTRRSGTNHVQINQKSDSA